MDKIMGFVFGLMLLAIFIKVGVGALIWLGPIGCLVVAAIFIIGLCN